MAYFKSNEPYTEQEYRPEEEPEEEYDDGFDELNEEEYTDEYPEISEEERREQRKSRYRLAMGFGNAFVPLTLASPFVMLFSYSRMPKNKKLSMLIPFFAIGLILVIVLEGAHLGAHLYGRHADKQMTVQSLIEMIQRYIPGGGRVQ